MGSSLSKKYEHGMDINLLCNHKTGQFIWKVEIVCFGVLSKKMVVKLEAKIMVFNDI